jgi:hypothetical protein
LEGDGADREWTTKKMMLKETAPFAFVHTHAGLDYVASQTEKENTSAMNKRRKEARNEREENKLAN